MNENIDNQNTMAKKKYNVIDSYKGSKGPIFCVDPHPLSPEGGNSFSDLFLPI